MDFFEYASFAMYFTSEFWVQMLVGALCFAIVFIFQGIALFVIARREGFRHRWMAFIPFFNTYYIGVCSQKNRVFNIDAKTVGTVTAVFEAVLFAGYVIYYVASYLVADYVIEVTAVNSLGMGYVYYEIGPNLPVSLNWAAWIYSYLYKYILRFVDIVFLIFEIGLLICFFQTYACRRYVLFAITSILFPIQGILFYVVRNNKAINYRDFVRAEQARQYRMYQQYQQQQNNFNGNPYNRNPYSRNRGDYDGYDNGNSRQQQTPPDDPFDGLGGSGSDNSSSPFDDFDN